VDIIDVGFGRTGTMSLKLALEQLGFGPCHHMEEVLKDPGQAAQWAAAAEGEAVDWDAVFDGYRSTVDWPTTRFWREVVDHYPDAKVILTVRDPDRWYESISKTIHMILEGREKIENPAMRQVTSRSTAMESTSRVTCCSRCAQAESTYPVQTPQPNGAA